MYGVTSASILEYQPPLNGSIKMGVSCAADNCIHPFPSRACELLLQILTSRLFMVPNVVDSKPNMYLYALSRDCALVRVVPTVLSRCDRYHLVFIPQYE